MGNPRNWCDLPAEMKMQCIKWMNFKSRCQLRQTSQTEKHLVETQRYPVELFEVIIRRRQGIFPYMTWYVETAFEVRRNTSELPPKGKKKAEIEMIFRLGAIERFHCDNLKKFIPGWISDPESRVDPFYNFPRDIIVKIDKVHLRSITIFAVPILRQCKSLKALRFVMDTDIPVARVFPLPCVYNCPEVDFANTASFPYPVRLVEQWIANDCQIGQRLHVSRAGKNLFGVFLKKFKNRIIYKTPEDVDEEAVEMRISTDNKAKHVFLQADLKYPSARSIACAIVPAGLEDPKVLCEIVKPSWRR